MKFFQYGKKETEYLSRKDHRLDRIIQKKPFIARERDEDIFSCLCHYIIGQQISSSAQASVYTKRKKRVGKVSPESVILLSSSSLCSCGRNKWKAENILSLAAKIVCHQLDLDLLKKKDDEEVIKELTSLSGVGTWTAERVLLFSRNRRDVFSPFDYGIIRGMKMVYHHRKITQQMFNRYKKRFSPYGSVASLYFWAVSSGDISLDDNAIANNGNA